MSKRRRKRSVESDFRQALERLIAGAPKDPTLAKRAKEGRLAINPVTVAKEANRSRTLVGSDNCAYPHIRELILQAGPKERASPTGKDVIAELRRTIQGLQQDLAVARTLLAAQRITIDALGRPAP